MLGTSQWREGGGRWLRRFALGSAAAAAVTGTALAADVSQVGPVLQGFLDATASQGTLQGVAIGVDLPGGEGSWFGGGGYRDIARTEPLGADLQFRIGSASKTFTGTAVLQQVDQGLIGLGDSIDKWVPDLNVPGGDRITVENLLSMTSGIPDYLGAESIHSPGNTILQEWANFHGPAGSHGNADYTPEQLVGAVVDSLGASFGPVGEMFYSNTNFALLGIIAQRASCLGASGCRTIDEMVNGIAASMGLADTVFPASSAFTAPYAETAQVVIGDASYYGVPPGSSFDMTFLDPRVPWAAGAVLSTPADELKWVRQLATNSDGLLSAQTQAERVGVAEPGEVSGVPVFYGLALYAMPGVGSGTYLTGHSGLIGGDTASLFYNPALDVAYAVNFLGYQANALPWFPLYGASDALGRYVYAGREGGNYSSVMILWALDRNVTLALTAQGSCSYGAGPQGAGGDRTCAGDSVRTTPIAVTDGTLTIAPSHLTMGNYYIDPVTGAVSLAQVARPSLAMFGSHSAAVALQGGASLVLPQGATAELWGTNSATVSMTGADNAAHIGGTLLTYGVDSVAVRIMGDRNRVNVLPTGAVVGASAPAIAMSGRDNAAVIGGSVTTYGHGIERIAIAGEGGGNRVEVEPTGYVGGDIALAGDGNRVRVDGIVSGHVPMAGGDAVLSGEGVITGVVGGGGTVAPGNGIGTLTVGGYAGRDTRLMIETGPGGASDLLAVAGPASLTGGSLHVTPPPAAASGIYNVLSAGAVEGAFAAATTGGRVGLGVQYTPTAVNVAAVNPFLFDAAVRTGAADTLRNLDLFEERAAAFAASATSAAPAGAARGPAAGAQAENLKEWFSRRGASAAGSRAAGAAVWASAYGAFDRHAADGPVPTIASEGGGVAVGADAEPLPGLLVGAMGAYSRTQATTPANPGMKFSSDAYKAGVYGAYEAGRVLFSASLLAGRGDDTTTRAVESGALAGVAQGSFDDFRLAARVGARATFDVGAGVRLTPRAAVTLLRIEQDAHREIGGIPGYGFGIGIGASTYEQVRSEASLAVAKTFDVSLGGWSGRLTGELRAGLARDIVLKSANGWVDVPGFSPVVTGGFKRNAWVMPVGGRLELAASDSLSVFAAYDGAFSSLGGVNTVRGGLHWRF
ncbi:MAG: serine hydrolase [Pseudochelatococcus sp.]|uniref:serine hydrolase n=1 Tax=Pseudochelatococcus sp. TaxID=2020869 RepID=UPI003D93F7AE